jgi:hypothetical protein
VHGVGRRRLPYLVGQRRAYTGGRGIRLILVHSAWMLWRIRK